MYDDRPTFLLLHTIRILECTVFAKGEIVKIEVEPRKNRIEFVQVK